MATGLNVDDGGVPGRLLIIGGAEDRCGVSGVLERCTQLCGGSKARIVLITTAAGRPGQALAEYTQVCRTLGLRYISAVAITGRADADGQYADADLNGATSVFF